MGIIKPTLSLTANSADSTGTAKGPLSVALNLSATDSLTVDVVNTKIVTVNATEQILYRGATLGPVAQAGLDGSYSGTELAGGTANSGGFLYMKNITKSGSEKIYIGVAADNDAATDIGAADANDTFGAATRLFTLLLGEFVWMPFDYTMNIIVDASGAGSGDTVPKLECWHFNRSAS
tara:strand:- start:492 stop:1025 length:534 start_codon:yes stop_codon:yes gene_type:complete